MINKILFDLDGPLTLPRQKMSPEIKEMILELISLGYEVGIVTGSGIDYLTEQLDGLICEGLKLYPCNGTQEWVRMFMLEDNTSKWVRSYAVEIDKKELEQITRYLTFDMFPSMEDDLKYLPPTCGDIIQNRGSMINFCPIGRKASWADREIFEDYDKITSFRNRYLKELKIKLKTMGYDVVLGGVTSFDIYPYGWDKTYVLQHLKYSELNPLVFIGNSFYVNGNDACMLNQKNVICLSVSHPEETLKIVNEFILEK